MDEITPQLREIFGIYGFRLNQLGIHIDEHRDFNDLSGLYEIIPKDGKEVVALLNHDEMTGSFRIDLYRDYLLKEIKWAAANVRATLERRCDVRFPGVRKSDRVLME